MGEDTQDPPKTYRLHALGSPEAETVLAKQGITRAGLEELLAESARSGEADVRTIIGINDDGVFGTGREGWAAHLPDAFREPVIALQWSRLLDLREQASEDDPSTD